jgi:hypothetical protein
MANIEDLKPFTLDLITKLKDDNGKGEINTNEIFISSTNIFHPQGLFSNDIFDIIGSEARSKRLGYIKLPIPIFHPLIYTNFINLRKSLHEAIINKDITVKLSPDRTEFIEDEKGDNGFNFMVKSFPKMNFQQSKDQTAKDLSKEFLTKYQNNYLIDKLIVIPPSLREYRVDEDTGLVTKDEINNFYSRVISITRLINNINIDEKYLSQYDELRLKLQTTACAIYDHIFSLLKGKDKFMEDVWSKRAIQYGTRNVITAPITNSRDLRDDKSLFTINHSKIGLYQYLKAIEPVVFYHIESKFISRILSGEQSTAELVNPKTMRYETTEVSIKLRERWLTTTGMAKIINSFKEQEYLGLPIKLDTHYLLMVYDDNESIKILWDNGEIDEVDNKYVRPITYGELFYLAVYDTAYKYKGLLTRYPITGLGSIYPCKMYLTTTILSRKIKYIMDGGIEETLYEYPVIGENWIRGLSPHTIRLGRLGADFDGDSYRGLIAHRKIKYYENNCIDNISNKDRKMVNNTKIVYDYGYLDMGNFPKEELVKVDGNVEYYKVPDNIEVLTIWNGKEKWVHPESYSIHKNLEMINVKTSRGNTLLISNDHSLVTTKDDLDYTRAPAKIGMSVPRLANGLTPYINRDKVKYNIDISGIKFNLNNDLGYLFGVIIGDGWVNFGNSERTAIMLTTIHNTIRDKVTSILTDYGYNGNPYNKDNPHTYDGFNCFSRKTTWYFKPIAELLRNNIGHGAFNKKLPDWWVNCSDKFKWGLLSGLLDTDGTIVKRLDKTNHIKQNINYSTTSERLANDIVALANSLGLIAGICISTHTRSKDSKTIEYIVMFNSTSYLKMQQKLKLLNPEKREKLNSLLIDTSEVVKYTPNIPIDRIEELISYIISLKSTNENIKRCYNTLVESRKKYKQYGLTYLNKFIALQILDTFKDFVDNNDWWSKFRDIIRDNNIEWEIIRKIDKVPEITEAYDVTVPPYCTFVTQNGIIAYDTCSLNVVMTEESINEIDKYLDSVDAYVDIDNSMIAPVITNVAKIVIKHMME